MSISKGERAAMQRELELIRERLRVPQRTDPTFKTGFINDTPVIDWDPEAVRDRQRRKGVYGTEAGDYCVRMGCEGIIEVKDRDSRCSCQDPDGRPPCGHCTTDPHFCPECGWDAEEEHERHYHSPKQNKQMNKQYLVSLFDGSIQTVTITHGQDKSEYTYQTRMALEVGDRVLTIHKDSIKIGTVARVHEEVELKADDGNTYGWAFQKVDLALVDSILKTESEAIKHLEVAERKHHREQVRRSMVEANPLLGSVPVTPPTDVANG